MRKVIAVSVLAMLAMASGAEAKRTTSHVVHKESYQPESKAGVKIGILTCGVEDGMGYVIGSSHAVDCYYKPGHGRFQEHYTGTIGKVGLDIGLTKNTTMVWAVVAPGRVGKGALKGSYGGVSAQASVVVGVGVNVMVGGFRDTISLQPLSGQTQLGLNAAAGISSLQLKYVGR